MCLVWAPPFRSWFLLSLHGAVEWLVWGWVHGQEPRAPIWWCHYLVIKSHISHLTSFGSSFLSFQRQVLCYVLWTVSLNCRGVNWITLDITFSSLKVVCVDILALDQVCDIFPSGSAAFTSCLYLPALCIMHWNQVNEALLTLLVLDLWRKSSNPTGSMFAGDTWFLRVNLKLFWCNKISEVDI